MLATDKHSSLLQNFQDYRKKTFHNIDNMGQSYKHFFVHNLRILVIS
jgi:hypothetical protein